MRTTPLRKPRPAHPAKDPYKRRSWESEEDYKDRVLRLDSESQEDLAKDLLALDEAAEWEALDNKITAMNREASKADYIRKKEAQANRLEKLYNSIKRATQILQQSKDTINLDVNTAYLNQEIKKLQDRSDKLHDVNLMLKSLETAGGLWGIALFAPYMYLKYGPQALNYIGRQFAKRGLINLTRQLVMPQLDMAIAAQTAKNGDILRYAEMAQDANLYYGAAIDAAQIYTLPDTRDKLINSAELIPVAFDKVNNNYARLFSNFGGLAANIYDVYSNLNE